jgi:hypothetical protein
LAALGGFHPWLTIEDPEVGMRFWANAKRLGIIANPLVEEVPTTFTHGVIQRKRWVAGFFQSLASPLREIGLTPVQRARAWLNFLPCLSMSANSIGLPMGLWAIWQWRIESDLLPHWLVYLCAGNVACLAVLMTSQYQSTWRRTALVLDTRRARLQYLLRVNPVFLMGWWLFWIIPLALGFIMYLRDSGLVWERTVKINANNDLILKMTGTAEYSSFRGGEDLVVRTNLASMEPIRE